MIEDYVIQVAHTPLDLDASAWDALLQAQPNPSPFMRHAYLAALHDSASATAQTGWTPHFIMLSEGGELVAACIIFEKNHSYGEYVFDWAWAKAYAQYGVPYYPKAVAAVPFTPVSGARLLARNDKARAALVQGLLRWCESSGMSSLHLLFLNEDDAAACARAGLMLRHTVQFHWKNRVPDEAPFDFAPVGSDDATRPAFRDFDHFLASLSQEKRKKIRQERRKVQDAGVRFRWALGRGIASADWDFFYRCYERTYLEHRNAPYLNRNFFERLADTMAPHWLLFIAEREGRPIASSLIALDACSPVTGEPENSPVKKRVKVAYGRYWGTLERVDCLHFEACYYQPLQWCIERGYQRFEGGAQGEHKMARALLPVKTTSAHWLAHPSFAEAVGRFLAREDQGISSYLDDLSQRNPFRRAE